MSLTLDPAAVTRARSLGDVGVDWLGRLPEVVEALARDWGLTTGPSLLGGTASWAGLVESVDGSTAVLKVALPQVDITRQVGRGPDELDAPAKA